jgi:prepilin signal peptidase PulO-like enzyme (type II secretory pathway)
LVLVSALIALAFIDFETTYLPDPLVYPVFAIDLLPSFFVPDRGWWQGLAGTVVGLSPLLSELYFGVLIGGLFAIFVYTARLFGFNWVVIPYGPYLVSGRIISMLYFRQITDWIETQF